MTKLGDMIGAVLAIEPTAPALEFEGAWRSWQQLGDAAAKLDRTLSDLQLGTDVRVAALLRNHADFIPVLLCLFSTGRCLATVNAAAPIDKLAEGTAAVAAPVIVALQQDWDQPEVMAAARQAGSYGIAIDDGAMTVVLAGDSARWTSRDAPGVAIEMLTSGTTGTPKRIPLPARNLEKALMSAAAYEKGRGPNDPPKLRGGVQIVTAPLAHISGITGVMNNVLAGRKVCLLARFSVKDFIDAVVRHRPKVAGAPPSALRMVLDADVPKDALASLVAWRTGTAPLDPDLADAFYEKYGVPVLQNYGATEFAGGAAGWTLQDFKDHWKAKRGSVGRLNPGAEARSVGIESGETLPAGEPGLLEIRAPNIGNGKDWVRTNDIAVVDSDNFLWIKGRQDNAIIRGGFKVLPDDVVAMLQQHPSIREAAVAGIADRRLGEVPVAAYIRRSGAEPLAPEALTLWLKERLMPYQVPVKLLEVDELPRTPSMKVSLLDLKALFAETA